jgi:hypothetical protein
MESRQQPDGNRRLRPPTSAGTVCFLRQRARASNRLVAVPARGSRHIPRDILFDAITRVVRLQRSSHHLQAAADAFLAQSDLEQAA